MATAEQEKEERARLDSALEAIASTDPEELVRSRELGSSFDFREGVPYFRRTIDLFTELRATSLDFASHKALKRMADVASQANSHLEQLRKFDPKDHHSNPTQVRDQLINQVRDSYDSYYETIAPEVAFATRKGTDFAALERNARQSIRAIDQLREEMEGLKDSLTAESEEILSAMRTAAAESGVAQTAIAFEDEADRQRTQSRNWLIATVVIALVLGAAAAFALAYWMAWAPEGLTTAQTIQIGLAKLLVFSVLYFALVWSGRNFLAHRHNETLNTHRQNALRTFQAFVTASADPAIKDAVLLQATQSIFALHATGYLARDNGGTTSTMPQILEILRPSATGSAPSAGTS